LLPAVIPPQTSSPLTEKDCLVPFLTRQQIYPFQTCPRALAKLLSYSFPYLVFFTASTHAMSHSFDCARSTTNRLEEYPSGK